MHMSAKAELMLYTAMKQQSLATAGFELATQRTRKRELLDKMNFVVPR